MGLLRVFAARRCMSNEPEKIWSVSDESFCIYLVREVGRKIDNELIKQARQANLAEFYFYHIQKMMIENELSTIIPINYMCQSTFLLEG